MALAALATVSDLSDRGVTIDAGETTVVETYLDVASAAVRQAAGAPISETTSTVEVEGPVDSRWLHLPAPPVTGVDTVVVDGDSVTDWQLRSHQLWRRCGWSPSCDPSEVEVTYTHGLPTVPADIVDLVCRIAAAALVAYRSSAGGEGLAAQDIRQERLGDYSVSYGDTGLITEMELPDYLRERLAARFGGAVALVGSR